MRLIAETVHKQDPIINKCMTMDPICLKMLNRKNKSESMVHQIPQAICRICAKHMAVRKTISVLLDICVMFKKTNVYKIHFECKTQYGQSCCNIYFQVQCPFTPISPAFNTIVDDVCIGVHTRM